MDCVPEADQDREKRLDDAIASYLEALDAGSAPDPNELIARNPDLAEELRSFFAQERGLGRAVGALRPGSAGSPLPYKDIDDYEVLEEIARGGMGVVFRARQKSLNRIVALKMVLAGRLASEDEIRRFRHEAEAAARLDHPNIVPIYEIGEHEGHHYFSMRLVGGGSLASRVTGFAEDPRAAARLLETIARAVHYAHLRGVVHRDLKPANVLLDEHDQPHVTDFGLARAVDLDSTLTRTGAVVGTPAYMAPEQAAAKAGKPAPATDVFSLGVILYELVTGRRPFRGESSLDVLRAVQEEEPPAPRSFNSGVPRDLETVCLKCLEKDARRRYASAADLADDLQRFLAGRPVEARRTSLVERTWRWCRRNPALTAVGLLLAVIALGSLGFAWRLAVEREATRENLVRMCIARSRAGRASGLVGQRLDGLEAVREAAQVRPSLVLRNEAIGCLVLPDLEALWSSAAARAGEHDPVPAFDAELARYAFSDSSGRISVRRVGDDAELMTLVGPALPTRLIKLADDGRHLAACYGTGSGKPAERLHYWSLEKPETALGVKVEPATAFAWTFHPDGLHVVVASRDGAVVFWSLEREGEVRRIGGGAASPPTRSLELDSKARFLAAIVGNRDVVIRDAQTGAELKRLEKLTYVGHIAWCPGTALLAICNGTETILWDANANTRVTTLLGHTGQIDSGEFTTALERSFISCGRDSTLRLWSTQGRAERLRKNGTFSCWPGPHGDLLGLTGTEGVSLWRIHPASECRVLQGPAGTKGTLVDVDVSPGDDLLAAATRSGVSLWDWRRGESLGTLSADDSVKVCFVDGGRALVAWGKDGLKLWPIQQSGPGAFEVGPPQALSQAPRRSPRECAVSGDGQRIAVVEDGFPNQAFVMDREGKVVSSLLGCWRLRSVALSPDGAWAAGGGLRGSRVCIWEVSTGKPAHEIADVSTAIVAFSPDGSRLVVSGLDGFRSLAVPTWSHEWSLPQVSRTQPSMVRFSPDGGQLIVQDAFQRDFIVLDPRTGAELSTLPQSFPGTARPMAFTSTGSHFFAVRFDNSIQVWDLLLIRRSLRDLSLDWDRPLPPEARKPPEGALKVTVLGGR